MKKISLLLIIIAITILMSCGGASTETKAQYEPNQKVYAFGNAHGYGDYLGFARITTDNNGNIDDVYIDEVFLPRNWAGEQLPEHIKLATPEVFKYTSPRHPEEGAHELSYAKYVMIGNKFFQIELKPSEKFPDTFELAGYMEINSDATKKSGGISNLEEYVYANQENGREYYDNAVSGKLFILKLVNGRLVPDTDAFKATPGNIVKANSTYWAGSPEAKKSLGFSNNMRYLQNYLLLHGFNFDAEKDAVFNEATKSVNVVDVVTRATNRDFKNYLLLAQKAHQLLVKK